VFVRWVGAEGETGGKACNGGCVRCARAAHDYGRMSTSVPGQCWRMALARGVYSSRIMCAMWDVCNTSIFLSESFLSRNTVVVRSCGRRIEVREFG
jgi:hypothetical protein